MVDLCELTKKHIMVKCECVYLSAYPILTPLVLTQDDSWAMSSLDAPFCPDTPPPPPPLSPQLPRETSMDSVLVARLPREEGRQPEEACPGLGMGRLGLGLGLGLGWPVLGFGRLGNCPQ